MAGADVTIDILKEIRDELRGVRVEVHALRTDGGQRIEAIGQRLDLIETTLLDLAGQNRLVVRYTKATSEKECRAEPRAGALDGDAK
ncbi:MAG TPA: hypothetical protein VHG72_14350 [Polyangia bacterium]|nr:hypothetical protein [Polyangia bacterium]